MFGKFDLLGFIKLTLSFIYTKLYFPQAKIIRLPFDVRNKKYIKFGKNFTSGFGCRIEAYPSSKEIETCIFIGDNVQINDYVHIGSIGSISIGNNVLMASKIYITDHNHGSYDDIISDHPMSIPHNRIRISKPVIIEDNVWLGESVCVLPGVTIGKGCVIGALSVVSKSIPPYSIAVGSPAKVVKKFNFKKNKWEKL